MRDDDPFFLPADFPSVLFLGLFLIGVMVLGVVVSIYAVVS